MCLCHVCFRVGAPTFTNILLFFVVFFSFFWGLYWGLFNYKTFEFLGYEYLFLFFERYFDRFSNFYRGLGGGRGSGYGGRGVGCYGGRYTCTSGGAKDYGRAIFGGLLSRYSVGLTRVGVTSGPTSGQRGGVIRGAYNGFARQNYSSGASDRVGSVATRGGVAGFDCGSFAFELRTRLASPRVGFRYGLRLRPCKIMG